MKIGPVVAATCLVLVAVGGVLWLTRSSDVAPSLVQAADPDQPTPSLKPPHPRVVTPDRIYDFGAMLVNETLSHDFIIRNDGEAELRLGKPTTTCKCTVPSEVKDGIAAGTERKITLEWTPKAAGDDFSQEATFKTNDPISAEISFVIHGKVDDMLRTEPAGVWQVGEVSGETPREIKGYVYSTVRDRFGVTGITSPNEFITVNSDPMTEEQLTARSAKSGYQVTVNLSPEMQIGRFNEPVFVKTDIGDENYAELRFDLVGTRLGPIQVIPLPGVDWTAEAMAVDLGRFSSGTPKSATAWLFVSEMPEGQEFRFEKVESSVPCVQLKLERDLSFKGKGRQRFKLTFEATGNCPVGVFQGKSAAKILVRTNHARAKEIKFYVQFLTVPREDVDKIVDGVGL